MKKETKPDVYRKRPTLTDPKEWAIIRSIHFEDKPLSEQADRREKRAKQKNHAR